MIHLANVLVAAADAALGENVLDRLRANGYYGDTVSSGAAALERAQLDPPDTLIVGPSLGDMTAMELVAKLKDDPFCHRVPVFLLLRHLDPKLEAEALRAGVDDTLVLPINDEVIIARTRPLVRVATMHGELHARVDIAKAFGVSVATDVGGIADDDAALLVCGPGAAKIREVLAPVGEAVVAPTLHHVEAMLSQRNFDLAILDPGKQVADFLDLTLQIRNNPRLFNLPVLMIGDGRGNPSMVEAHRKGASRLLDRPLDRDQIEAVVRALVRRQRLRWSIREHLIRTLAESTSDPETGAYGKDFLMRYLEKRVETAKIRHRHLTVISFTVPNVDAVREQWGDDAATHLLSQLGHWISGLLRSEDVTARGDGNEFVVVLPDTPLREAEVVANRIAGVLAYTDFAIRDVYQPVKVWVQVGATDIEADDTAETIVARARQRLS